MKNLLSCVGDGIMSVTDRGCCTTTFKRSFVRKNYASVLTVSIEYLTRLYCCKNQRVPLSVSNLNMEGCCYFTVASSITVPYGVRNPSMEWSVPSASLIYPGSPILPAGTQTFAKELTDCRFWCSSNPAWIHFLTVCQQLTFKNISFNPKFSAKLFLHDFVADLPPIFYRDFNANTIL